MAVPDLSRLLRPAVVAVKLQVEGAIGGVEKPGPPLQYLLPNSGLRMEKKIFVLLI